MMKMISRMISGWSGPRRTGKQAENRQQDCALKPFFEVQGARMPFDDFTYIQSVRVHGFAQDFAPQAFDPFPEKPVIRRPALPGIDRQQAEKQSAVVEGR